MKHRLIAISALKKFLRYIISGRTTLERNLGLSATLSTLLTLAYIGYWILRDFFWNKYTTLMFLCLMLSVALLFLRFKCEISRREARKYSTIEAKRLKLSESEATRYLVTKSEVEITHDWIFIVIAFIILSTLILLFP